MTNIVPLPDALAREVHAQRETGMDYSTGEVTLIDGTVIPRCVFVGGRWTNAADGIGCGDIEQVRLTHERWQHT